MNKSDSKHDQYSSPKTLDADDGIFSYLGLYYCRLAGAKPFALMLILAWMVLLFLSLGIVAGDFFSVNLGSMARELNMSDTLAGVTLLALGNGAPDIFSTVAAMSRSSQDLALGELLGAAAFITSVVAGSMPLIRPFAVVKLSLVRDIVFLLATTSFLAYVMVDGHLRLWHCIAMLIFYFIYVFVVVGWHWWLSRHQRADVDEGDILARDGHSSAQHEDETRPLLAAGDTGSSVPPRHTLDVTKLRRERREPGLSLDLDEDAWYEEPPEVIDYRFVNQSLLASLHHHHRAERLKRPSRRRQERLANAHEESQTTRQQLENDRHDDSLHDLPISSHGSFYHALDILLPGILNNEGRGKLHLFVAVMTAPICLPMKLTVPVVDYEPEKTKDAEALPDPRPWHRWLLILHVFLSSHFVLAVVARQLSLKIPDIFIPSMIILGGSLLSCGVVCLASTSGERPRWARFLSIAGFIVSVCWISLIADEIVGMLQALGIICNIPEAILGLTFFAIGNSMDDLAANVSMVRHDHPVMALAACFGGPLLNILLGVSLSGILVFVKQSIKTHHITPIDLQTNRDFFITAGILLVNLAVVLLMMLWTKWKMTKLLGSTLIIIWLVGTIMNVSLETKSG
ncbi:hypothetical protein LTR06_011075 [Exophiala xenobiotica]|nr:hypothetical protein LTR06_011075 [Exophiala xenobiotica]